MIQQPKQHQLLIDACKENNQKAELKIYDLYCDAMYNIALRYVNTSAVAEDVVQEAFIKAFKNIGNYQAKATFGAWLKRIVINQSLDWLKKQKLQTIPLQETLEVAQQDENWMVASEVSEEKIYQAIDSLQGKQKVIVQLFLLEGYDHQEIAQILEITEVASRSHLLRGRQKLMKLLS